MGKGFCRERGEEPPAYTRWDPEKFYYFYRRSYFDIDWDTHEQKENSFVASIFDRKCEKQMDEFKINF